jgi:TP901 family phage tail tape measure protein
MVAVTQDVTVKIKAKDNASRVLKDLRGDVKKTFGNKSGTGAAALAGTAKAAFLGVGAALTVVSAGLISASRTGAEFEKQMSRVQALTGADKLGFEKLSELAKDLGSSTAFSASEASEGMQSLAMAGFNVSEIMESMNDVLTTAAAAQLDLGSTADIASNIMSGFGIGAEEMGNIADVLTATFTTSNTTLASLGETMKFVGPIAHAAGADLSMVAAAAGLLGNAGLQGSLAGTALRGMFQKLAAPTKEAKDQLDKLNIELLDEKGYLKDLPDLMGEFKTGMKDLDPSEQTRLITDLVGLEGMSGFQVLLEAGPEKIGAYSRKLRGSFGLAARIAKTQTNNLDGSFKELGSTWEGLNIAVAERINPTLKKLTDEALIPLIRAVKELVEGPQGEGSVEHLGESMRGVDEKTGLLTVQFEGNVTALENLRAKNKEFSGAASDATVKVIEYEKNTSGLGDTLDNLITPMTRTNIKLVAQKKYLKEAKEAAEKERKELEEWKKTLPDSTEVLKNLSEQVDANVTSFQNLDGLDVDWGNLVPEEGLPEEAAKVGAGGFLQAWNHRLFGDQDGISGSLVDGMTDMIEGGSFKSSMQGVANAIGGMIGGPVGALVGKGLGEAISVVSSIFSSEGKAEKRLDAIAGVQAAIAGGSISGFKGRDDLNETLKNTGSARLTLDAFSQTFGLSAQDAAGLIRTLSAPSMDGAAIARFNTLLGATKNQGLTALASSLIPNLRGDTGPGQRLGEYLAEERYGVEEEGDDDFEEVARLIEGRGGIVPAARGFNGMVSRPTLFLAGEAGPEQVNITPEGSGASGGPVVHITMNNNFLDVRGVPGAMQMLGPEIVRYLDQQGIRGSKVMTTDGIVQERAA